MNAERVTSLWRQVRPWLGFETLLTLLYFSGRLKGAPLLSLLPFDLTLFLLLASAASAVLLLRKTGIRWKPPAIYGMAVGAAFAWMTVSSLWSPALMAGLDKSARLLLISLPMTAVTALVVAQSRERTLKLLVNITAFCVLLSVAVIIKKAFDPSEQFVSLWGSLYLGLSRSIATAVPLVPYLIYRSRRGWRTTAAGAGVVLLAALLLLGGRMALLAALTGAVVAMLTLKSWWQPRINWRGRSAREKRRAYAILAIAVAVLLIIAVMPGTLRRTLSTLTNPRSEGTLLRVGWYEESVHFFAGSPLIGHGFGSWSTLSQSGDRFDHPHSMPLEVGVESGAVGLLLLTIPGVFAWMNARRHARLGDVMLLAVDATVLTLLLQTLTGGDLNDNRLLFAMAALIWVPACAPAGVLRRVTQLTVMHGFRDPRILYKESTSLDKAGYAVTLIAPAPRSISVNGIQVQALPERASRLRRFTEHLWRAWSMAQRSRPDVVHLHDPILQTLVPALVMAGCRVVIDVHEYTARQFFDKSWLPRGLRPAVTVAYRLVERCAVALAAGVVVAGPQMAEDFPSGKTVVVQNFPRLDATISSGEGARRTVSRRSDFVYVGALSEARGAISMLDALPTGASLALAGVFQPPELENALQQNGAWSTVDYHGVLPHEEVLSLVAASRCGLAVLHPRPNYIEAWPTKLFEYMAAGLPVIASDFPLWRDIVEHANCGLLVDPMDTTAITDAMTWILDHPTEAHEMGTRGREAVLLRYNWEHEAKSLVALYERILQDGPTS